MADLRFSVHFGAQFAAILDESERVWNYRDRTYALVRQAAFDLAADPRRRNARWHKIGDVEVILYHTKWSTGHIPEEVGRILQPPYVLVARLQGDILRVLAILRESAITPSHLRRALRADRPG